MSDHSDLPLYEPCDTLTGEHFVPHSSKDAGESQLFVFLFCKTGPRIDWCWYLSNNELIH